MKLIPLFRVTDLNTALEFYTGVLNFEQAFPLEPVNRLWTMIRHGDAYITLSETDGVFGVAVTVIVDEVDDLFANYKKRGLVTPGNPDSPVHEGPLDQTWGRREFYVTDADGNTLRFSAALPQNYS